MKKHKQNIPPRKLNNYGFSLVELIISIAILAIVMIPLMSSFFRSMQMNKKAEELQRQSNLAANIMESIKTLTMTDILSQFSPTGSFNIIDQTGVEVMRLKNITGGYEGYPEASSLEEQATYYFAIHGIIEGGTAYDTLITMNSVPYHITGTNTMNDFPMPDVINLDKKTNGLLLSMGNTATDTLDSDALDAFLIRGQAYARKLYEQSPSYLSYLEGLEVWKGLCEEAVMGGTTPPTKPTEPPVTEDYSNYTNPDNIRSLITKTMKVTINQKTIDYVINYNCAWTPVDIEKSIQVTVSSQQYAKNIENIYLFYEPSQFAVTHIDLLELENIDTSLQVNFYVARQSTQLMYQNLEINHSIDDNIMVFTNLSSVEVQVKVGGFNDIFTPGLVKGEVEDRIYNISVDLCEYVSGDSINKYKKILFTMKSTKEK